MNDTKNILLLLNKVISNNTEKKFDIEWLLESIETKLNKEEHETKNKLQEITESKETLQYIKNKYKEIDAQ